MIMSGERIAESYGRQMVSIYSLLYVAVIKHSNQWQLMQEFILAYSSRESESVVVGETQEQTK